MILCFILGFISAIAVVALVVWLLCVSIDHDQHGKPSDSTFWTK